MTLFTDRIPSPLGTVLLVSDGESLCALDYEGFEARMERLLRARFGEVRRMEADDPQGFSSCVRAYFAGRLDALDGVPVSTGGTGFQRLVWAALREIPLGRTVTYGELAARLGKPTASRAVGHANSLNPVAIAVPCHRVIGGNRSLTGYAGGIERKRWLLGHEGAMLAV